MGVGVMVVASARAQGFQDAIQLVGLVLDYVREKSGGILAPALLHGLPQAIAYAVMVFFPLSGLG